MDHGSFTPLVFSTFGGLGYREETVFYIHLADLFSKNHSTLYTKTILFIALQYFLLSTLLSHPGH